MAGRPGQVGAPANGNIWRLGNPERGFDALVHFGLKALWRACRERVC